MNRRSSRHLRYILVPFLAAVMFIAAISISDSYNSSSFPEFGSAENDIYALAAVSSADTVSEADAEGPSASDAQAVSAEPRGTVSGTDGGEAARETAEAGTTAAAARTETEKPAAETTDNTTQKTTGKTTDNTTQKTTEKTTGSVNGRENAPYVSEPDYESRYYIVVFIRSQNVVIYGKGSDGGYNKTIKSFTCSSGRKGHSTRLGLYSIIRRYRWRLLVGDVYGQYSTGFSPSYLFHSVPYLEENDPSSLDMAEYDKLGEPASKGCIRLCVRDAKWIFDNCPDGTQINIVDAADDTPCEPIIPRKDGRKYSGWDPSDPDPNNPYNND